jgi:hypothetical protein
MHGSSKNGIGLKHTYLIKGLINMYPNTLNAAKQLDSKQFESKIPELPRDIPLYMGYLDDRIASLSVELNKLSGALIPIRNLSDDLESVESPKPNVAPLAKVLDEYVVRLQLIEDVVKRLTREIQL